MDFEDVDRVSDVDDSLRLFRIGLIREYGQEVAKGRERRGVALVVRAQVVNGEAVITVAEERAHQQEVSRETNVSGSTYQATRPKTIMRFVRRKKTASLRDQDVRESQVECVARGALTRFRGLGTTSPTLYPVR